MLKKYENGTTSSQPGLDDNKGPFSGLVSPCLLTSATTISSPLFKHLFLLLSWPASPALFSGLVTKYSVPFLGSLSSLALMSGQIVDPSLSPAEKSKYTSFQLSGLAPSLASTFTN